MQKDETPLNTDQQRYASDVELSMRDRAALRYDWTPPVSGFRSALCSLRSRARESEMRARYVCVIVWLCGVYVWVPLAHVLQPFSRSFTRVLVSLVSTIMVGSQGNWYEIFFLHGRSRCVMNGGMCSCMYACACILLVRLWFVYDVLVYVDSMHDCVRERNDKYTEREQENSGLWERTMPAIRQQWLDSAKNKNRN